MRVRPFSPAIAFINFFAGALFALLGIAPATAALMLAHVGPVPASRPTQTRHAAAARPSPRADRTRRPPPHPT